MSRGILRLALGLILSLPVFTFATIGWWRRSRAPPVTGRVRQQMAHHFSTMIGTLVMRFRTVVLCLAATLLCSVTRSEEIRIVVPNEYAGAEGEESLPVGANFRFQQIYAATEFTEVVQGNNFLTEVSWRPDGSAGPFAYSHDRLIVRASVTTVSPSEISWTFAENITGPVTTVVDRPSDVSTQSAGPPGEPKVFDVNLVFDQPFVYDPTEGNLLLDLMFYELVITEGVPAFDGTTVANPDVRLVGTLEGNLDSPTAEYEIGGNILQFTLPEPSTLALLGVGVIALLGTACRRRWKRTA